jgi:hypothetical protein
VRPCLKKNRKETEEEDGGGRVRMRRSSSTQKIEQEKEKEKQEIKTNRVAQEVESLPSKCEALSSNPNIATINK